MLYMYADIIELFDTKVILTGELKKCMLSEGKLEFFGLK